MKVEVVAGVAQDKGKYLVGRKFDIQKDSEIWEFPGGKIEVGETVEGALRREWKEELEVEISKFNGLITTMENKEYRLYFCAVEILSVPTASEHQEISWLEPDQIGQLKMHALDSHFVLNYLL